MWNRRNNQRFSTFYLSGMACKVALCVSAFVWWGVLYPELCFTEGTCEQVILEKGQEIVEEQTDCSGILDASGDEVVIRSRLLEWIEEKKNEYE